MKKYLIIICLLGMPSAGISSQPILPEKIIHQARGFGDSNDVTSARVEICKEILRLTERHAVTDAIAQAKEWMLKNFFSENARRETMDVCGIYLKGVIDGRESMQAGRTE